MTHPAWYEGLLAIVSVGLVMLLGIGVNEGELLIVTDGVSVLKNKGSCVEDAWSENWIVCVSSSVEIIAVIVAGVVSLILGIAEEITVIVGLIEVFGIISIKGILHKPITTKTLKHMRMIFPGRSSLR